MVAFAAQNGWKIYQLDVKSSFLHGELNENVFVEQPKGCEKEGSEHQVDKLRKALYGLKQEPRAWFSRIEALFIDEGFKRSANKQTLFTKKVIISVYVDDLIYTDDENVIMEFKALMMKAFEMTDLGKMKFFLGI